MREAGGRLGPPGHLPKLVDYINLQWNSMSVVARVPSSKQRRMAFRLDYTSSKKMNAFYQGQYWGATHPDMENMDHYAPDSRGGEQLTAVPCLTELVFIKKQTNIKQTNKTIIVWLYLFTILAF